jgi:subtilisin family serine protease
VDIHELMDVISRIGEVMLRRRKGGGRLLATAFCAVVLLSGGSAGLAQPSSSSETTTTVSHGGARQPSVHRITLITGDAVNIGSGDRYTIIRGPGRDRIRFAAYRTGGHLHVVPSDAIALLKSGRLDSRLFDVTALASFGYDERKTELPLIVASPSAKGVAKGGPKVTAPADAGLRIVRDLKAVNGSAAKASKKSLGTLWKGLTGGDKRAAAAPLGTAKVWLDGVRKPTLDESVPLIGAPTAWQAGYTGAGVKVAVLDTGIDDTHPDLAGKVIARQNFAAEFPDEDDLDRVGHGTHVASTIAGSGAASNGRFRGVAPDAQLLNGKVCVIFGCDESWILAGMQWAAEQGADVINMSLGGGDAPDIDPLEQAVNDLTAQYGVLFVIAAGNSGDFGDSTVGSPASADAALAVGATSKQDELASFSSRGPRVGDSAVKPDIAAPGVDITAARSSTGFLGEPGQSYMALDGTSMATPHAAGAAAILVSEHPTWTPAQLKATLTAAAKPLPDVGAFGIGAGRLDVARAITQTVTSDKSVSFGKAVWPHSDDAPVTKTVTYSNSGSSAVTLQLSVNAAAPGGATVPGGLFTLSATSVTVPAGGTASVEMTADTRVGGPDGLYSGQLVGTAGGVSVSTGFGLEKEVESYNITVKHTERDGDGSEDHLTILGTFGFTQYVLFDGPTQTLRVPRGDYIFNSWINEEDAFVMLFQPKLTIDHDVTVDADARLAKQVNITVPDRSAQGVFSLMDATVTSEEGFTSGFSGLGDGTFPMYSARLGSLAPDPSLVGAIAAVYAVPGPDGTIVNAPTVYHGAWFYPGDFPTGADKPMTPANTAKVVSTYHNHLPDVVGVSLEFAFPQGDPFAGGWAAGLEMTTPLQRTTYFSTDPNTMFQREFDQYDADFNFVAYLIDKTRTFTAGTTLTDSWNNAVFGPSFASATMPWEYIARWRDRITVGPPLYSDGSGHAGYALFTSGKTTLWRNGKVFATSTEPFLEVEVPKQTADYRAQVEIQRPGPLSTKIIASWTFRSASVPASDNDLADWRPEAVTAVSFAPMVDGYNKVAAGQIALVPINISAQAGTKPIKSLTVESSINDGLGWKTAGMVHIGSMWYALVPQKSGAFVSLRAHAVDTSGKTVAEETIIRAYQVK